MNNNRRYTERFFSKDWYQKIVLYNCLLKSATCKVLICNVV